MDNNCRRLNEQLKVMTSEKQLKGLIIRLGQRSLWSYSTGGKMGHIKFLENDRVEFTYLGSKRKGICNIYIK